MSIDSDDLYQRITRSWYNWAEEHGQVPVWPPRHGSQTAAMARIAVHHTQSICNGIEAEVLDDVATFIRMQKKKNPKAAAVLDRLAASLEDGSWEDM